MLKIACFLQNTQTLRVNNSKILTIRNAKSLGRYVHMNLNIWRKIFKSLLVYFGANLFQNFAFLLVKNSQAITISVDFL